MKTISRAAPAHKCLFHRTALSAAIVVALLGSACSTTGGKDSLDSYNNAFSKGDYAAAAAALSTEESSESEDGSTERNVLNLLHIAEAQRLSGDYEAAIASYEKAEAGLKSIDTESTAERAAEGAASFVGKSNDYEPYEAEKILINTYMALAYLSLGQSDDASVQFTRAADRTQRSIESFAKQLSDADKLRVEAPGGGPAFDLNALMPASMLEASKERNEKLLAGTEGDNDTHQGYDGFMVPAATYLGGIYHLANNAKGDKYAAQLSLRQLTEMYKSDDRSSLFEREFRESESHNGLKGDHVWVLYENGQAPALMSYKSDIDLTVGSKSQSYAMAIRPDHEDPSEWRDSVQSNGQNPYVMSIALPGPVSAVSAGELNVASAGERQELTTFSSMTAVSVAELDRRNPATAKKALVTAAIKLVAQKVAADKAEANGAGFGGFAARIAGKATSKSTNADTRSWRSLPSHWEVARFTKPADNAVVLNGTNVNLPADWSRTLVYVKRPTATSPMSVSIIDLQGNNKAIEIDL